jgi:hypothetical protein
MGQKVLGRVQPARGIGTYRLGKRIQREREQAWDFMSFLRIENTRIEISVFSQQGEMAEQQISQTTKLKPRLST